jgi:hypothetical protein
MICQHSNHTMHLPSCPPGHSRLPAPHSASMLRLILLIAVAVALGGMCIRRMFYCFYIHSIFLFMRARADAANPAAKERFDLGKKAMAASDYPAALEHFHFACGSFLTTEIMVKNRSLLARRQRSKQLRVLQHACHSLYGNGPCSQCHSRHDNCSEYQGSLSCA